MREVATRTYSEKIEKRFSWGKDAKFPTINILKSQCREVFGINEGEHIEICKYVPWEFEWKHMDPNE